MIGAVGLVVAFFIGHPISITTETDWAIGIYQGDSYTIFYPALGVSNPILRSSDVTDVKAEFVADPFMVREGTKWHMFFEVMNSLNHQGDIGYAVSQDGLQWNYQRIVLDEPFHISFPYVFQWEGQYYMIPESAAAKAVRLYRAEDFPCSWTFVSNLIEGTYADTCIFWAHETWWMLTCSRPHLHDELRLFFADKLTGPWTEHPASPLVHGDASKARPGGRILVVKDGIIRFAQDDLRTYGKKLQAFLITEISRTKYTEREYEGNPVLSAQGRGWNRHGMHHLDAHEISPGKWLAAVDGYRKRLVLRMEY
jgi:hypothetical protein